VVLQLGVGRGANNKLVTKDHKKPRTWTDSLDKRPKRKKMDMRFGTWNVRSMYRPGSLRALAEEISFFLDLVIRTAYGLSCHDSDQRTTFVYASELLKYLHSCAGKFSSNIHNAIRVLRD
jgi:hypothetical protein